MTVAAASLLGGAFAVDAEAFAGKEPAKLVPHRAIYQMTLDDARSASGITGIDGRMVFEFTGSECDGYSLNMRMVTQMTDSQGQTNLTDLRSSTWEQGDGQKFRFQSAQYLNEKLGDVTMGRAVRDAPNAVNVRLSQPSRAELNLPGQVLFPTQHSRALIDAALDGATLLQARIYDGSEKGRKVYDTTAFIGDMVQPGSDESKLEAAAKEKKLGALASWPVSIGYFEPKSGDLTPSYQIDFRLYANGVSRELFIDYGDFSIHGTLTSLEYLKSSGCQ